MKFSIVTPSFNQCAFLAQTMQSILSQQGDFDLEWIVVDGGSTDGTVELLKSISDPRVRWTSEKDRGQSDAVNKGLSCASGEIVGWLNSDDLYTPGALDRVRRAFGEHAGIAWLAGRCAIIDSSGKRIREGVTEYKNQELSRYSYRNLLRENAISQPAVFWRREFGQAVGELDVSLHHTMDYDLWLRMGRRCDPYILNRTIALFRLHGQSKSGTETRGRFAEGYGVAKRYFNGDRGSQIVHWLNGEKIVWSYRLMRLVGW